MRAFLVLPLLLFPLTAQRGPTPIRAQHRDQIGILSSTPSVVNAASFTTVISPGSLVTIFGARLVNIGQYTISAGPGPLPTALGGIQVFVNGIASPIAAISSNNGQDQINFQLPYEAAVMTGAPIEITNNGGIASLIQADVSFESPGTFTFNDNQGSFVRSVDNTVISPQNPARAGDFLYFYATGLGPVRNQPPTGFGASAKPLSTTLAPVRVDIAGQPVPVLFAGLAPGMPGVYQVNIQLPVGIPVGDLRATLSVNTQSSQTVRIRVQ